MRLLRLCLSYIVCYDDAGNGHDDCGNDNGYDYEANGAYLLSGLVLDG